MTIRANVTKLSAILIAVTIVTSCSATKNKTEPQPAFSVTFQPDFGSSKKIIVFVHGVFGDPTLTWTNRSGVSWQDLMQRDKTFETFSVAQVRYDTPLLNRTSTIEEIAIRVLRQLEDENVFKHDEIYFVAHSMGGLVTKRMLVTLNRQSQIEKLRRVKAVLFISTPAQGADIADLGSWLSHNPQLRDMRPADLNSFLQSMENQWQDLMRDRRTPPFPQSYCAYETKPTYGVVVVSRVYSATLCDQNPFPVDENHSDIVKPPNAQAVIYKWAQARILEANALAERARLQFSLTKTPYNYRRGLTVDGIEWRETYGEYEFIVRNPSKNETINDVRLRFELPWTIVNSQITSQSGCDGLVLSKGDDNTFKIGNEQVIRELIPFRTNVLEISVLGMLPEASFRGKLILNSGGRKANASAWTATYRYGSDSRSTSHDHKISVLDDGVNVRIDSQALQGNRTAEILLESEKPFQIRPPKPEQITIGIPPLSVGIVYEASSFKPVGTGFLLDDPRYVVTAWHVAHDADGNSRHLLFHGVGGEGPTAAIPIELYRSVRPADIAIMKLDGVNGAQELLIRGNSDKLDSGDLVGYGGLMMSEDKPGFQVSAHRIRRISNQQGVRTFEIRGTAKAGFVGGPVFGAGNTVVGVITKVTPIDDNASVFFAVDVAVIPKIP